jgi:cystathionine beta-lyase
VVRALRERVDHGVYGYGPQLETTELSEVFADRLQKRYGWRVSPEALVMIPGVIPGFNVACRMLASPGEGIAMQTPLYPPLLRVPGNIGLRFDEVPLARDTGGRYSVDLEAFAAAIQPDTRIFLLCNPHNPVGRVFAREELAGIAEVCLRRGLAIVSDEIHCDLVFSGHRHLPIASLDPAIADRTITLMAPSKTFNLAGLKCSLAIIPDQALRERFVAARLDLVQTTNILGYTAALAAYRDGQPWLDDLLRYLEGNRDALDRYVRANLPGLSMVAPEGTYLAWLDCRAARLPGNDPFTFFLERGKVAFNDGAAFGTRGQGFVRLNFGCPRVLLEQGLAGC